MLLGKSTTHRDTNAGRSVLIDDFQSETAIEEFELDAANEFNKTDNLVLVESESCDSSSSHNMSKAVMEDAYASVSLEDDSPYPEVRASVPSTDDPTIPQNTLRMWVIGLVMTTIGSALNVLFTFHSPSFYISSLVTALLAWPIGLLWARLVPKKILFGIPLNPGKFNIKEHTLIIIMSNVSFGGGAAYAVYILMAMKNYYGKDFGWGFDLLAIITTQSMGLCLAGLSRKVLINPSSMIWPQNLVTCTFLTNAHMNVNYSANGWQISRLKFFLAVCSGAFIWYWIPGFLFRALSYFAWVTWIKPKNVIVNQVFGVSSGLGILPISFDWNQFTGYIGSPLVPPASVLTIVAVSVLVIYWGLTPILHYSNVWYGEYLPVSDSYIYDRFQNTYNSTRVLTDDLSFDDAAYKEYSPLYLPAAFAISYAMIFAASTSVIVHTFLFHGKTVWKQFRIPHDESDFDVHARLMKAYKPCPDWWYAVMFVCIFALSIVMIEHWPTDFPVYALVLALLIAIVFIVPVGVLYAVSNISMGLNVISEFIGGYVCPGKPIANMFFKTFTYITNSQAVTYTQDLKLGHYMKLAPKVMFFAQAIATVWGSVVQLAVMKWAVGSIDGLCETNQKASFSCPNVRVFFNASVIWGVIGAKRQFAIGSLYQGLLLFFIIGAILPIINWLILKKRPNSFIRHINWPAFFAATGNIAPATPYNYALFSICGLFFGFFVKRRWFHWWSKYNYTLSAALDTGLAWSGLVIFLTLTLTNVDMPSWWGNDVINTIDYNDEAVQVKLEDGQWFGLKSW